MNEDGSFTVFYSMRNHSKEKVKAKFIGTSFNLMEMINEVWIKKYPSNKLSKNEDLYQKFLNSSKPFLQKLSDKTLYLRIPSFVYSEKEHIDNLLEENDKTIKSTENLIIDIRNGTGGSDYSYFGLLPYIYTNPIRRIGMLYRATELNASAFEGYAKEIGDQETINYLYKLSDKIRNCKNKYYDDGVIVDIESSYSKSIFPKKVAIICNKYNGSTDESFLYDAKQSQKVKIFGTPTIGALNTSNINTITTPNKKYTLYYTLTLNKRVPNYLIDDIGIQPDIYIDETIDDINWIDFVKKYLEQ